MKVHRWKDVRKKVLSAERIAANDEWVRDEILEMNLQAVRELLGKTQTEVAEAAKTTQPELSKTERREDHRVSTLRRYVEALGGELEIVATFGEKMVRLKGV